MPSISRLCRVGGVYTNPAGKLGVTTKTSCSRSSPPSGAGSVYVTPGVYWGAGCLNSSWGFSSIVMLTVCESLSPSASVTVCVYTVAAMVACAAPMMRRFAPSYVSLAGKAGVSV